MKSSGVFQIEYCDYLHPGRTRLPEGEYYAKAVVTAKTSGRVGESEGINIRSTGQSPGVRTLRSRDDVADKGRPG